MKHTPGPWKAVKLLVPVGFANYCVQHGNDGESVADIVYKEADATLIATAPELLEALRFCVSVIKSQGMFDRSEQLAYEKGTAAITKATNQKEPV